MIIFLEGKPEPDTIQNRREQVPKIYLIDVTNRDGVQTARLGLAKLEKTLINMYLNEVGIFQSEFGFPVTKHEMNYLNANLELAAMGVIAPMRLGRSGYGLGAVGSF